MPNPQPVGPGSLFVWVLSFDVSSKGDPTSSYATAGIALWVIAPRKPPYPTIMPSSRWRYLKEDFRPYFS